MPTNTPNLSLEKPIGSENYDVAKLNANFDKIDTAVAARVVTPTASKTTPVDADSIVTLDSAASNAPNKLTWANLKAAVKSYLDGFYSVKSNPIFTGVIDNQGGQIKFPSTQNPSSDPNTLADYEKGSFTPTIEGTTTSGVGTYSVQSGRYTKIDRLVQVEILLNWTAHTGTGSLRIAGLPFASLSNAVASIFNSNVALSANNVMVGFTNGLIIAINQVPVGGGANTNVAMDTAGLIYVNVTYMTT